MTKTKTNRVRASVRKPVKSLRELNTGKMNKVMSKFIPARYDLVVEFALTGDQDLNDPVDFLPNNLSRLEMGSGYNMMTGHRDFSFAGTEQEMKAIMQKFCSSPFKVIRFSVYPDGEYFNDFNDGVLRESTARAQRRAKAKRSKR